MVHILPLFLFGLPTLAFALSIQYERASVDTANIASPSALDSEIVTGVRIVPQHIGSTSLAGRADEPSDPTLAEIEAILDTLRVQLDLTEEDLTVMKGILANFESFATTDELLQALKEKSPKLHDLVLQLLSDLQLNGQV